MNLKEQILELVSNLTEGDITKKSVYCDTETNLVCFNGAIAKLINPELPCERITDFCLEERIGKTVALESNIGSELIGDINDAHAKLCQYDITFEQARQEVYDLVSEWDDTVDWQQEHEDRIWKLEEEDEYYDDDED